ncbi:hypothetical protein FJT64_020290 [Amphibalanus amphitrite]|uniref:Uncharacterized protein n=1 Tax=Amphibalanus amphitrite TaxID=1232801 RepID=A0A6A4WR34_AMPAM|nr:hypothetical protein FJT64_020290 [Amphibalanus amphitrite]
MSFEDDSTELCGVRILCKAPITIIDIYRPPTRRTQDDDPEDHFDPGAPPPPVMPSSWDTSTPTNRSGTPGMTQLTASGIEWLTGSTVGWSPLNSLESTHSATGLVGARDRRVVAKRRAAETEKRVSQAHFRNFVKTTLNKPGCLGSVTKILKEWEGASDGHRPGRAITESGRLLVTDSEKAEALNARTPTPPRSLPHSRVPGTTAFLYADDTAALCPGNNIEVTKEQGQRAADILVKCTPASEMVVAGQNTQALVLSQWARDVVNGSVRVARETVVEGDHLKLLGVTMDRLLHFEPHCRSLRERVRPQTNQLRLLTGREWAGLAPVAERRAALAARLLAKARALPAGDPLRKVAESQAPTRLSTVTGWRGVGEEIWRLVDIIASIKPIPPCPTACAHYGD